MSSLLTVENVAVVFGLLSVYLAAKEHVWNWPTGMINVGLYTLIFFQQRLYADMGLQVVYFVLSAYGWYEWLHGGTDHTELHVTRTPRKLMLWLVVIAVAFGVALTQFLARFTNAAVPAIDSTLTTVSLVAQFMMTRKYIENWPVWVAVDIAYVWLFIWRGLYPTAIQYFVFTLLALYAWREWHVSMKAQPAPASAAA